MAKAKFSAPKDIDALKKKFQSALISLDEIGTGGGRTSSGSIKLDKALSGGIPDGIMIEYYGPPQSGKSTAAIKAIGVTTQAGHRAAIIDIERGLDLATGKRGEGSEERLNSWIEKNGADLSTGLIDIWRPTTGEELFDLLDNIIAGNLYKLVVVDSVAAISTAAELEGEIGDATYGAVARLMSSGLKRLMTRYGMVRNEATTIIWINQIRDVVNSRFPSKKSTGGNALPHYCGIRCRFWKMGAPKEQGEELVQESRVLVEKSRYGPSRETSIYISDQHGIDAAAEVIEYAMEIGYIAQTGSWYHVYDRRVDFPALKKAGAERDMDEGYLASHQGMGALKTWVAAHQAWFKARFDEAVTS